MSVYGFFSLITNFFTLLQPLYSAVNRQLLTNESFSRLNRSISRLIASTTTVCSPLPVDGDSLASLLDSANDVARGSTGDRVSTGRGAIVRVRALSLQRSSVQDGDSQVSTHSGEQVCEVPPPPLVVLMVERVEEVVAVPARLDRALG